MGSGKVLFRGTDGWRLFVEDRIGAQAFSSFSDYVGVGRFHCVEKCGGIQRGSRWWWNNVCCVPGEDGMLHLALGFSEGGVVKVMVVGVARFMELDEGLSGEQGVMVVDRESRSFMME